MRELEVVSLFTGAGGLDYGFEAAGFRTAVAVEIDPRCVATLKHNRNWPIIQADINDPEKASTQKILDIAGLVPGRDHVLIGGPPCQPFSKSGFWATGETRRLDDPRAGTLGGFLRVLREARPRAFLLENVEGLGFRGKDEGLALIADTLVAINAELGTNYIPHTAMLNAAWFGVPQERRRLFIVGARDGAEFTFPRPTHVDPAVADPTDNRPRFRTAWDAFHDLPEPQDASLRVTGRWAGLLPSVPEGQNYLCFTDRGGIKGDPIFGWRRRYWSFLLKLAKNQPAWTLQAQPGPATGPFHWTSRKLSMREMARLQTFPDDIEVLGSHADVVRQIGNAVPSLLAEVLAREIRRQLLGESVRDDLQGTLQTAPGPVPMAEPVMPIPPEYDRFRGQHTAHPGTGKGHRASSRLRPSGSEPSEEAA